MARALKKGNGNATINDVARLAGVSKRTVSRVINQSENVNPSTRKKILEVIEELGFSPSKQARGLASRRSYLLGLVYNEQNPAFIHSIQNGILSVCVKHGYELVVHPFDYQSETLVMDVLKFVGRARLDGIIILPPSSANQQLADALRQSSIHYVRLAAIKVDDMAHMVISADRLAMSQVADLFVDQGHKYIGIVTGPAHRIATTERFEGLRDELARRGISSKSLQVERGDFSYESGRRCATALLKRDPRSTAIFASNDEMAIGVINQAMDLGLNVPSDLVVVGYDDGPLALRLRPSLTTLRRPNETMAHLAAKKLIALIGGDLQGSEQIATTLMPELILRESTALDSQNAKLREAR